MSRQPEGRGSGRKKAGRIGSVAGIDVYVHWTFLLLVAWIFVSHLMQGHGVGAGLQGLAFIGSLFGCVLLHELGHALAAKRYGVRTRDITLYPIGGVARLERIPERPAEELAVAFAGPAVNLVLAFVFGAIVLVTGRGLELSGGSWMGVDLLTSLVVVNLVLAVFNLLPAFPMDGGRVLRALLAMRLDYVRATQIAATAGQGMAILLGILGLFANWFLLFIALFVFIGAQQEAHMVQTRAMLAGIPVRAAMVTRIRALEVHDLLEVAVRELIAGTQQSFPVLDRGRLVGFLPRTLLLQALAEHRQSGVVGDVMLEEFITVEDGEMIGGAFEKMQEAQISSVPVLRQGALVGLLTLENVGEWLMVQASLRGDGGPGAVRGVAP